MITFSNIITEEENKQFKPTNLLPIPIGIAAGIAGSLALKKHNEDEQQKQELINNLQNKVNNLQNKINSISEKNPKLFNDHLKTLNNDDVIELIKTNTPGDKTYGITDLISNIIVSSIF